MGEKRTKSEERARVISIARSQGNFFVGLRYRDEKLRRICHELRTEGLLVGGRRDGRHLIFYPAAAKAEGR